MVAEGMWLDKRIGRSFLNAGIGYGGSCFPKDVKAFIKMAKDNGVDFSILEESEKVNKNRRVKFIEKIENILWINKDKNITIWGLSFKPNTDDIREAPSIDIVKQLNSAGANLRLYDPEAAENFKNIFPESDKLRYFSDMYGALEDSDALIILTEWEHFISANLEKIKNTMKLPIIIDGRNIFDESLVESYGFEYYSIGR
jgi:UDPglucose 6-dehydrogenase